MDEPGFMAMGGQAEAIASVLRERHDTTASLSSALALAAEALGSVGGENGAARKLGPAQLEVAVLDRRRMGRAFRRISGPSLITLLEGHKEVPEKDLGDVDAAPPPPREIKPTVSAAPVDAEGAHTEGVTSEGDATGEAVNGDGS